MSAQFALAVVIKDYARRFELMSDEYLRERAVDIKDLGRRILAYLQENESRELAIPDNTILVSDELTPTMLGEVPRDKLLASFD